MSARVTTLLILVLAAAFAASTLLPFDPLRTLFDEDRVLATSLIVELRLPRALLALAYGAMLGAAGAAVQALFANPLASPDTPPATHARKSTSARTLPPPRLVPESINRRRGMHRHC